MGSGQDKNLPEIKLEESDFIENDHSVESVKCEDPPHSQSEKSEGSTPVKKSRKGTPRARKTAISPPRALHRKTSSRDISLNPEKARTLKEVILAKLQAKHSVSNSTPKSNSNSKSKRSTSKSPITSEKSTPAKAVQKPTLKRQNAVLGTDSPTTKSKRVKFDKSSKSSSSSSSPSSSRSRSTSRSRSRSRSGSGSSSSSKKNEIVEMPQFTGSFSDNDYQNILQDYIATLEQRLEALRDHHNTIFSF